MGLWHSGNLNSGLPKDLNFFERPSLRSSCKSGYNINLNVPQKKISLEVTTTAILFVWKCMPSRSVNTYDSDPQSSTEREKRDRECYGSKKFERRTITIERLGNESDWGIEKNKISK